MMHCTNTASHASHKFTVDFLVFEPDASFLSSVVLSYPPLNGCYRQLSPFTLSLHELSVELAVEEAKAAML